MAKIEQLAQAFWRVASTGSEREQRKLLMWLSIAMTLFVFAVMKFRPATMLIDTPTYYSAGELNMQGLLDAYRTPVYPLLCALARMIAGEAGRPYFLIALQTLAFWASIPLLLRTCCLMSPNGRPIVRFIAVALYCCSIAVQAESLKVCTESLSLSAVVVLLWLMVTIFKGNGRWWHGALLGVLYLTMLFLRPYFICFAPVLVLFMILAWGKSNRGLKLAFFAAIVLNAGAYVAYCHQYEKKFGVFTTNCIGIQNFSRHLWVMGLLDNPAIYQETFDVYIEHERCREAFNSNRTTYFHCLIAQSIEATLALFPDFSLPDGGVKLLSLALNMPLKMWLYLWVVFVSWHIWRGRKRKKDVRIHAVLSILVVVGIFTAIVGSALANYGRLAMPVYPILCLMIAAPGNFREEE